jgi:hypothetical protein
MTPFALLLPMMLAAQAADLKSRAEATGYEETSRYDDVQRLGRELLRRSPLLRAASFGKSEEGRDLPLWILADPPAMQPRDVRVSDKPVVLIMANIHGGEVEGKEAAQHIARRLAGGDLRGLLERLVVLIAPIYNADGNERISTDNRVAQHGPVGGVGVRANAKSLDLNRDFMKLASAEARALVGLFNEWDPHLVVDLHTSNGSYHAYHLTYSPMLNPNADARLMAYQRERMLPTIAAAMREKHNYRTYYYGNVAGAGAARAWRTFDHRPRFGNNYVGLRHRLAILSEAYSYLDFRGRVAVTEVFVEEILRYTAEHAATITGLLRRVDQDTVRRGLNPQPAQLGVEFQAQALPGVVDILLGGVERRKNPRSGREMTAMVESQVTPTPMPDFGQFAATRAVALPRAYLLRNEPDLRGAIENLRAHGIAVEELLEPLTEEVDSFEIEAVQRAERPFQGRNEVRLQGRGKKERVTFPAGTLLVRTAQPLGTLAFYLLEPESDDGLVTWGFFDSALAAGRTAPVYKLFRDLPAASRLVK